MRYAWILPKSLVNLVYHLVTKTMPTNSCAQNELISQCFLELESCKRSFLFSRLVFWLFSLACIFLFPWITSFLSFLSMVAWVWIPNSCSGMEFLQMGTLPNLLINSWGGIFQLPLWLVIHIWVRGLFWVIKSSKVLVWWGSSQPFMVPSPCLS